MVDNPYLNLDKKPDSISNPYLNLSETPEETGRNRKQFLEGSISRELIEGIGSGGIGIFEGILGAAAIVPDYFTGSDYGDKVTAGAEALLVAEAEDQARCGQKTRGH